MTEREAVAMFRERRALQLIAVAITRQSPVEPNWEHVLVAITDRLAWSSYAISVTDPQLLARAAAVLDEEPDGTVAFTDTDWATAWKSPH